MDRLYDWVNQYGLWGAFEDNVAPFAHLYSRAKDDAAFYKALAEERYREGQQLRSKQADAARVRAYLAETIEQRDKQIAQVKGYLALLKQTLTGGMCAPYKQDGEETTEQVTAEEFRDREDRADSFANRALHPAITAVSGAPIGGPRLDLPREGEEKWT